MKTKRLLIDLDIVAVRAAHSADSKSGGDLGLDRACKNANTMMMNCFMGCDSTTHTGYLGTRGDKTQHRYQIFPAYKANRAHLPVPKYLEGVRDYLIKEFNVEVVKGIEADDALSIEQHKNLVYELKPLDKLQDECVIKDSDTVICSIDKDLDIVPGWHYNFIKGEKYFVTEIEGLRFFYSQIIEGDSADGIPRIVPKIRLTKHIKLLNGCHTELDLYLQTKEIVVELNKKYGLSLDVDKWIENRAQILYPLKELHKLYQIPGDL